MVTVEKARKYIEENILENPIKIETLGKSLGLVLAEDILSPINMPPFSQSAMDGYAVSNPSEKYIINGEIKAGDDASSITVKKGEAYRIFTGAMVPKNAKYVVIQEHVTKENNKLILPKDYQFRSNIRPLGEQIMKSDIAAKKGTLLNAGLIGYLTTLGITEVPVYKKPKISIIATGNELIEAGESLKPGKIYESNTLMLQMALEEYGFTSEVLKVKDDYEKTKAVISKVISENDLIFISGGISVGDYDFVHKSLLQLGVKEIFYKVKQKPGKPLYFGKHSSCFVFALPGNPAAALSSFYIYGLPAIAKMIGRDVPYLETDIKALMEDVEKPAGRTFFLKGKIINEEVKVLTGQSSAMLNAFTEADCLIELDQEKTEWKKGEKIKVLKLKR